MTTVEKLMACNKLGRIRLYLLNCRDEQSSQYAESYSDAWGILYRAEQSIRFGYAPYENLETNLL